MPLARLALYELKEMVKMRKLLVLLPLAFVMCVPESSCAEPQKRVDKAISSDVVNIGYITQDMEKASEQLQIITQDLRDIGLELEDDGSSLVYVKLILEHAYVAQGHFVSILQWYWCIREQCVEDWRSNTVRLLKNGKANAEWQLTMVKKSYPRIKTPAAFHVIDKARNVLRSTVPLYDRAIQILEAKQEKK
jgi:hypothetical protein